MSYLISKFAAEMPDGPALIDDRGTTTWSQLDARVNGLIHAIRGLGVAPDDTVAVMARNRRELVELCLAALHSSIRIVMVNWHWVADEVAYVMSDSGASVLFYDEAGEPVARAVAAPDITLVAIDDTSAAARRLGDLLAAAGDAEPADQAIGAPMFYTSGTTGRPKGVHSTQIPVGEDLVLLELLVPGFQQLTNVPSNGVSLLCGPYYHSAQWVMATIPLAVGSALVLHDGFDPARVLEAIDAHGVTNLHLVPAQFERMLALPDGTRDAFDGSSLVLALHGAAPCRPATKHAMLDWWGPCVTEYYGGTEGGFISVISGEEWLPRPGSVGRPTETMEVQIRDDDGSPLPAGEPGQIWFRSVLGIDFEYHNAPDKTAESHDTEGFGTLGDVGYLDVDGYLYLTDRKIDMIISGGVNIYPAETETVLAEHPGVADVAVFGVPDAEMGENVKAAVALKPGFEPDEATEHNLIAFARGRLAGYKAPKSVDFHDELPRSEAGKLLKAELRAPYWAGHDKSI